MTDASQPRSARGKTLPAAILATALFALLAFAPFASAASDPVGSGSTTLTINGGFKNYLKTFGISIQKIKPAKLKGAKVTLTVTGGKLDPLTGLGEVTLGGGFKFKAGKKTAPVKGLVLNTSKKTLTGKVTGKQMKFGTVAGFSFARDGFGVNLKVNKLKLTGNAATALNKKLGYAKGKPKPFLGKKLIAKATSETQPSTVVVLPTGNATLQTELATVSKFKSLGVDFIPVAPTTRADVPLPQFTFPISGGTIGPNATAGTVQTAGGVILQGPEVEPDPVKAPGAKTKFSMDLNAIGIDLATKQATVEVVIKTSNPVFAGLVPGNIGRASIADLDLTGATIASDPVTHTVSVSNAKALLQAVTAETLNQIFAGKKPVFVQGDSLGTFSFTAQTQ